jgi:hypothetical protein
MRWQLSGRLMLINRPSCDEDFSSARHEYLHPELLLLLTSSFARLSKSHRPIDAPVSVRPPSQDPASEPLPPP